jgi:hypothetical protein
MSIILFSDLAILHSTPLFFRYSIEILIWPNRRAVSYFGLCNLAIMSDISFHRRSLATFGSHDPCVGVSAHSPLCGIMRRLLALLTISLELLTGRAMCQSDSNLVPDIILHHTKVLRQWLSKMGGFWHWGEIRRFSPYAALKRRSGRCGTKPLYPVSSLVQRISPLVWLGR